MSAASAPYNLADTWRLNNRVNLMLVDQLTAGQLAYTPSPRARTIADQIGHLHNVRIMWLEVSAPAAAKSLSKIAKGSADKELLRESLVQSGEAMGDCIVKAEAAGKMRGAKRGPVAYVAYMLAHESHHRGQIILHLKYAKMPVDPVFSYSIWEWDKI